MPTLTPNQKVRVNFVHSDEFPANCTVQSVRGNVVRLIQHEQYSSLCNRRGWFAPIFLRSVNDQLFAIDPRAPKGTIDTDLRVEILSAR
jgi:hypothetical protein